MKRRDFILSMLSAGLAGPLLSAKGSSAGMTTMGGMSETPTLGSTGQAKPVTIRAGQPLRALPKLVNQSKTPGVFEASLTAAPARLDVGAGQQTEFWAYNGMIPGPLIEATAGDRVLLSPAERADVIVTFRRRSGHTVALQTLPYERGWMGGGKPPSRTLSLLTVRLAGVPVRAAALPTKLRKIEELGTPGATKRVEFGERMPKGDSMSMSDGGMDPTKTGRGMAMQFLINGKAFKMGRVDLTTKAGQVELWEVVNPTDMDHPFHLHGTQFQVTERERDGSKTKAPYLAWKDTVNIAPAETVRFKVRQDMKGLRMYHCHILEHEDQGMMGVLDVI